MKVFAELTNTTLFINSGVLMANIGYNLEDLQLLIRPTFSDVTIQQAGIISSVVLK